MPPSTSAWALLSRCSARARNHAQGLKRTREARARADAARRQDAGRLAAAEGFLRRATALDPGAADAYNNLGTLLRSSNPA